MEERLKKKLKNRIWIISSISLSACSIVLLMTSAHWVTLLPIIIPAGIFTIGIPAYDIVKTTKENSNYLYKQPAVLKEKDIYSRKELRSNEMVIKQTNNMELDENLYPQYELEITQDNNKVKTKGTIH